VAAFATATGFGKPLSANPAQHFFDFQ